MRIATPIVFALFAGVVVSCSLSFLGRTTSFDSKPITIQTVDFFNQRIESLTAKKRWKGDWLFRRSRLELIDRELRQVKPDLLILQQVMARKHSPSESDSSILRAGALTDYEWQELTVRDYPDTKEAESMAVAVGLPLRIVPSSDASARNLWMLGSDGFMTATTVDLEWQPMGVFNVQMPSDASTAGRWYSFIEERITEYLHRHKICPRRTIVSGFLPATGDVDRFAHFSESLELKDSSLGYCQAASRCYTATPTNDIFMATSSDQASSQVDRILVHRSTYIYSSTRNFATASTDSRFLKAFGLPSLWPTRRFGWTITARLPRCDQDELP